MNNQTISQIARRNLIRHKRHSLLLILLFAVITALFYTGNALIAESNRGMKASFIDSFTADFVVKAPTNMEVSLFGAVTPSIGEFYTLPVLSDRDSLEYYIREDRSVEAITPLIFGACSLDAAGARYNVPVFGVEGDSYFSLFNGVRLERGGYLKTGEAGVMITRRQYERIRRDSGKELQIGDPILLSMYQNGGFKIREVPLKGVFSYARGNPQLDEMVLTDIQTIRVLNGLSPGLEEHQTIFEDDADLLNDSLDALFLENDSMQSLQQESVSADDVFNIVDSTDPSVWKEGGSCHFLLVRLKKGASPRTAMARLGWQFSHYGLEAELLDWRQAAGFSARLVSLLQIFFNAGFTLVALAGVIALVNILLISVFDRTGEVGTLRAIGARREFVHRLFLLENLILAALGGLAGIILASLFLSGINALQLPLYNGMLNLLLGKDVLEVGASPLWLAISLLITLLLGWAASAYPIRKAMAIQPVTAQSRSGE